MDNKQLTEEVINIVRKRVPEFKVIAKSSSLVHRIIGYFFSLFGADYMRSYYTTLGYTAAYPEGGKYAWDVFVHEGRHAIQAKRFTRPLFSFLYLFPISLFPIVLLLSIFWSPWFLLGLILCAAPIPSPFRAWAELGGYRDSVILYQWMGGHSLGPMISDIANFNFAGAGYWFMFPFREYIEDKLLESVYDVRKADGKWRQDDYLVDVYNLLERSGLIVNVPVRSTKQR